MPELSPSAIHLNIKLAASTTCGCVGDGSPAVSLVLGCGLRCRFHLNLSLLLGRVSVLAAMLLMLGAKQLSYGRSARPGAPGVTEARVPLAASSGPRRFQQPLDHIL